jgi:hypothetical protein
MLFLKPLCSALVNQVGASYWGANPSLQERSREPKVSSLLASHLASDKSEARFIVSASVFDFLYGQLQPAPACRLLLLEVAYSS